jgi:hypothetical protein
MCNISIIHLTEGHHVTFSSFRLQTISEPVNRLFAKSEGIALAAGVRLETV